MVGTAQMRLLPTLRRRARSTHPPPPSPPDTYSCRDSLRSMTELLRPNVSSVKCGAVDELGMAGGVKLTVNFPGLVKSAGVVVEPVDPGQRREHRDLVPAVPPAPRTADRRPRWVV